MNPHAPLDRRTFLATATGAAAALGFPTILRRAHARPAPGRVAANDRIGVGFIGCGMIARAHIGDLLGRADVQCLAVCDVDTTRRDHAKKMVEDKYAQDKREGFTGCEGFDNYVKLLARSDIDAVVISTPDHWHGIQALDAFRAGKDVYLEKPLTLTIAEAKAIMDASKKLNRILQTGSQQRTEYSGRFRTACEYVRSGRIGPLLTIHVGVGTSSVPCDLPGESAEPGLDWDRWLGPAPMREYNSILSPRGVHNHFPDWRKYREYSGGLMTDWGAHHFDIAQWALDADASGPVEIIPPRDEKAMKGATFVYPGGVRVVHGGPFGITFVGAEGMIYVDRDRLFSTPEKILTEPLAETDVHLPQAADHRTNWLECIRSRNQPICSAEVGARSVTVCHLGNLAYWHRRPLKWNPQTWEFPGDIAANGWRDVTRRAGYELPIV